MKQKSVFLTIAVLLGLRIAATAQSNCDAIGSVTITSTPHSDLQLRGAQAYVNNQLGQDFLMLLEQNDWNYVAFTKGDDPNAGASTIYLNGQLIFAGNYTYNNFYNWTRFILGYAIGGTFQTGGQIISPFEGFIDEVRLSSVVRSESEILQNYLNESPFAADANTIGLWHLDETSGFAVNGSAGVNGMATNVEWSTGVWGNCAQFNGINSGIIFDQVLPTSNITCEFWIKPTNLNPSWPICYDGSLVSGYTSGFVIDTLTTTVNPTWSTGESSQAITVEPTSQDFIWVNNGNCTDTIWFNSQSATVYDTIETNVTVYDTLVVEITDTTTVVNVVDVFDTLTVYNNIDVFDTITVAVEVFDTLTNVIDVFDTITVYLQVEIYDTLFSEVYDTTYIVNTVDVYDTLVNVIDVFDTTTVFLQVDIYDTLFSEVYDTTYIENIVDVYDTTYVTVTDTTHIDVIDTTYITVTDTLIINLNPTGFNPVTYENTILMFPNPTSEQLTIDYGDFASLAGYTLKIFNSIGQEIHSANISQQQEVLQLGTWGGAGTYQVVIYNAQGVPVDTRAIVLQ